MLRSFPHLHLIPAQSWVPCGFAPPTRSPCSLPGLAINLAASESHVAWTHLAQQSHCTMSFSVTCAIAHRETPLKRGGHAHPLPAGCRGARHAHVVPPLPCLRWAATHLPDALADGAELVVVVQLPALVAPPVRLGRQLPVVVAQSRQA